MSDGYGHDFCFYRGGISAFRTQLFHFGAEVEVRLRLAMSFHVHTETNKALSAAKR